MCFLIILGRKQSIVDTSMSCDIAVTFSTVAEIGRCLGSTFTSWNGGVAESVASIHLRVSRDTVTASFELVTVANAVSDCLTAHDLLLRRRNANTGFQ